MIPTTTDTQPPANALGVPRSSFPESWKFRRLLFPGSGPSGERQAPAGAAFPPSLTHSAKLIYLKPFSTTTPSACLQHPLQPPNLVKLSAIAQTPPASFPCTLGTAKDLAGSTGICRENHPARKEEGLFLWVCLLVPVPQMLAKSFSMLIFPVGGICSNLAKRSWRGSYLGIPGS